MGFLFIPHFIPILCYFVGFKSLPSQKNSDFVVTDTERALEYNIENIYMK